MSNISAINLDDATVSINDLRRMIPAFGKDLTILIQSEPGVGKSSLLTMLEKDMGDDYDYIYVDCPNKDAPDIGMVIPNHNSKSLEYYVSSLFKLDSNKPKVIMLDEYLKAPKMLQVVFTRLMLERYVGDVALPKGSIVFATSNNVSDGVGDSIAAHVGNRVMRVRMRKSTAAEWCVWAGDNGVSSTLRAWVTLNPKAMASYKDGGQEDNEFIFHPSRLNTAFVSPRSLAKSSIIVDNRAKMGPDITMAALAGTIGLAAAKSLSAFLTLESELMSVRDVIKNPEGVPLPTKQVATFIMIFNAVDTIETQDDLTSFIKFINRLGSSEIQSIFYTTILESKRTARIARNNASVMEWYKKNHVLVA